MTDQDLNLIHQAKSGNVSAYNELYQNYYQFVYRYAWKLSKNEADARDIAQEVFLQVYKSLPSLRDETLFVPWLRKITNSKCQMIFRKNKDILYDSDQISMELGKEKRREFVPQDYMRYMSDKEILTYLLSQMSEKKRMVLDMFYLQQMSINEIAEETGIHVNTVKGRLHEGRKALLKMVNEFEEKEGRKITFRLDPIPAIVLCVVSGGLAIKGTYELYHMTETGTTTAEKTIKKEEHIVFHPVVYQNRTVTSTNDAYFIIMGFAIDKDLLAEKSDQELKEIQPVVKELCATNNAYREALIDSGWLKKFEALL